MERKSGKIGGTCAEVAMEVLTATACLELDIGYCTPGRWPPRSLRTPVRDEARRCCFYNKKEDSWANL